MSIEKWNPTVTKCPLDGEITVLDSSIYSSPITTSYGGGWREGGWSETESARCLGMILGCGHILAADQWQHRIATNPLGVWVGWWVRRTDPELSYYPIPSDAVPLKPEAEKYTP